MQEGLWWSCTSRLAMKMVNQSGFGERCWGRVEWPQHTAGYCTVPAHADLMAGMDNRWRAFIGVKLIAA